MARHKWTGRRRLKGRVRTELEDWVLCGVNPVVARLKTAPESVAKIVSLAGCQGGAKRAEELAARLGVKTEQASREQLEGIAGTSKHQGIAAFVSPYGYSSFGELLSSACPARLVFLDGVSDPRNFGAILRSAEAFGAGAVVVPTRRAAPLSPVVARTAAGAMEYVKVARVVNLGRALDQAKEHGYWILGLDPLGDRLLTEIEPLKLVGLVVGGEGEGLRVGIKKRCDFLTRIAMAGRVGSLNAAVAAAVGLFWLSSGGVVMPKRLT